MGAWMTRVSPEVLAFEDARRAAVARCRLEASVRGYTGRIQFGRTRPKDPDLIPICFISIHETWEENFFRRLARWDARTKEKS
jgi:hypothetical protein